MEAYYVYAHLIDGRIFYIGSGLPRRPYVKSPRSLLWNLIVSEAGGYEVKILARLDNLAEARQAEREAIFEHRPRANIAEARRYRWIPRPELNPVSNWYRYEP